MSRDIDWNTQPQQIHLQTTDQPTSMVVIWATEGRSTGEVEWNGQKAKHRLLLQSRHGISHGDNDRFNPGEGCPTVSVVVIHGQMNTHSRPLIQT